MAQQPLYKQPIVGKHRLHKRCINIIIIIINTSKQSKQSKQTKQSKQSMQGSLSNLLLLSLALLMCLRMGTTLNIIAIFAQAIETMSVE